MERLSLYNVGIRVQRMDRRTPGAGDPVEETTMPLRESAACATRGLLNVVLFVRFGSREVLRVKSGEKSLVGAERTIERLRLPSQDLVAGTYGPA